MKGSKTQNYYTQEDYNDTILKLPEIIKKAEQKSLELMEPNIYEQREIIKIIKDFVRKNNRKIYGGTAVDELLKLANPKDAVYDDYHFGDIDFYSPKPVVDLVNLCDILYNKKKFKVVNGKEAFHEESFRIYVNMQMYCNITYVPTRVYYGIKTINIDGLDYVDPHFIWIDQLRIATNPLIDSRLWEQTFKRSYLLLKNYPPEYINFDLKIYNPSEEINRYINNIKQDFLTLPEIQESTLVNGFEAYNFYIRFSMPQNKMIGGKKLSEINVPYLELTTINYTETVMKMYEYLKTYLSNPELLTFTEYFPLFQFIGYSITFIYDNKPIVTIYESSSVCIPIIRGASGMRYASYQYLLMFLLINKFRSYLDKDKEMYMNYQIVISNFITARNNYLKNNKLNNINNSPFSEFRIQCIGTPINPARLYVSRKIERRENGKRQEFTYSPESFFKMSEEAQNKFDPEKACFKNTSGNIIGNLKWARFKVKGDRLVKNEPEPAMNSECVEEEVELS